MPRWRGRNIVSTTAGVVVSRGDGVLVESNSLAAASTATLMKTPSTRRESGYTNKKLLIYLSGEVVVHGQGVVSIQEMRRLVAAVVGPVGRQRVIFQRRFFRIITPPALVDVRQRAVHRREVQRRTIAPSLPFFLEQFELGRVAR